MTDRLSEIRARVGRVEGLERTRTAGGNYTRDVSWCIEEIERLHKEVARFRHLNAAVRDMAHERAGVPGRGFAVCPIDSMSWVCDKLEETRTERDAALAEVERLRAVGALASLVGTSTAEMSSMVDAAQVIGKERAKRRAAEAERDEAVALLRELEWIPDAEQDFVWCGVCQNETSPKRKAHAPDCRLDAYLKRVAT